MQATKRMAGSVRVLLVMKENATRLVADNAASVAVRGGGLKPPGEEAAQQVAGSSSRTHRQRMTRRARNSAQKLLRQAWRAGRSRRTCVGG